MQATTIPLWQSTPGTTSTVPYLVHYTPERLTNDAAILLIPGSGYCQSPALPRQEGERIARYLCDRGISCFVLVYRIYPDVYPLPLLDGRRAVRLIRHRASELGIRGDRIVTVGFSAGGHLAAALTSYKCPLAYEGIDEIDAEDFTPNLQALCYPVISMDKDMPYTHAGSASYLLSDRYEELRDALSLEITHERAIPPTFLYHNFDDASVGVENSLLYAARLRTLGTAVEMHIFPDGGHGIGLPVDERADLVHDKIWLDLFVRWLGYNGFLSADT